MNTKADPSPNDGYTKADPNEPMFVLLARDPQAPLLIRQWARDRRLREGMADPKAAEALEIADAMEAYRAAERPLETDIPADGVHVPDPADFRTDFRNHVTKDGEVFGQSGFEEIQEPVAGLVVDSDAL